MDMYRLRMYSWMNLQTNIYIGGFDSVFEYH